MNNNGFLKAEIKDGKILINGVEVQDYVVLSGESPQAKGQGQGYLFMQSAINNINNSTQEDYTKPESKAVFLVDTKGSREDIYTKLDELAGLVQKVNLAIPKGISSVDVTNRIPLLQQEIQTKIEELI